MVIGICRIFKKLITSYLVNIHSLFGPTLIEDEESDQEAGIFERKELLTPGESVLDFVGNKSERQVLAALPVSLCVGIRIENWSKFQLNRPQVRPLFERNPNHKDCRGELKNSFVFCQPITDVYCVMSCP